MYVSDRKGHVYVRLNVGILQHIQTYTHKSTHIHIYRTYKYTQISHTHILTHTQTHVIHTQNTHTQTQLLCIIYAMIDAFIHINILLKIYNYTVSVSSVV